MADARARCPFALALAVLLAAGAGAAAPVVIRGALVIVAHTPEEWMQARP